LDRRVSCRRLLRARVERAKQDRENNDDGACPAEAKGEGGHLGYHVFGSRSKSPLASSFSAWQ
jgi:hypothetical protein